MSHKHKGNTEQVQALLSKHIINHESKENKKPTESGDIHHGNV